MGVAAIAALVIGAGLAAGSTQVGKGKKPNVPGFSLLDTADEQKKAIRGNASALPELFPLGKKVDEYNVGQHKAIAEAGIPGFGGITSQWSNSLQDLLAGKLPEDVQRSVMKSGAARNLEKGIPGTISGSRWTTQDLGQTSLDEIMKGMSLSPAYLNTMQGFNARPFDVTSEFLSPQDVMSFDAAQRGQRFDRDWLAEQITAMPSPKQAAVGNMMGSTGGLLMGAGLGGIIGGGGGGMGGTRKPNMGGLGTGGSWNSTGGFGSNYLPPTTDYGGYSDFPALYNSMMGTQPANSRDPIFG